MTAVISFQHALGFVPRPWPSFRSNLGSFFDRGVNAVSHALKRLEREGVACIGRKIVRLHARWRVDHRSAF